jgi:DNA-binding transcriptional ArsR family regulator
MNRHDVDDGSRDLAAFARLLADGTRASFCLALLDGRAWTATELARHAGVAASTATGHLNLLVAAGLLTQERQGRHRYVRLSGPGAAEMIEGLAAGAAGQGGQADRGGRAGRAAPARSLSAVSRHRALARARTCYDHLAGALGVAVTEAMTGRALLDTEHGLALTGAGLDWLAGLGLTLPAGRRPPVRTCLDWTERRPHLAGAVGALVCRHALDAGWITRVGTGRAVLVTSAGRRALSDQLGVPDEFLITR